MEYVDHSVCIRIICVHVLYLLMYVCMYGEQIPWCTCVTRCITVYPYDYHTITQTVCVLCWSPPPHSPNAAFCLQPNSDIVLGAANGMESFIHDRYALGRTEPAIDTTQNILNASTTRVDGYTVLDFTRALDTRDSTDDVSLAGCVYFLYGYNGPVANYNGRVGYHRMTPNVSPARICLSSQCTGVAHVLYIWCVVMFVLYIWCVVMFVLYIWCGDVCTVHMVCGDVYCTYGVW